ncbi:MAG: ABC transporter permease [Candidatus Polarisedimenticolia bacterium]
MAIPLIYNVLSLRRRWLSSLVAVLGVAGAVGVFVAMLSLARGFQTTLVASGSPRNAIVQRAGASSEMVSGVGLDEVRIVSTAPGVARDKDGPLVSAERVVVAGFALRGAGSAANAQVRGVSPRVLDVRRGVRIVRGRFFRAGLAEIVVGAGAARSFADLDLGNTIRFGGGTWTVVGVFDAGGSAFDSETWCDADVLAQVYKRPRIAFQSVTARLDAPSSLAAFQAALAADPRLNVQAEREVDYYEKQSRGLATVIRVLGFLVAGVMGIGAVFAALNTMYAAVAERSREVATLRALGFGAGSVVLSFVAESLVVSAAGGLLGCLAVLPINGLAVGTMNWQTFSHLAFAFKVSPGLLVQGMVFALFMGLAGGVPPALRAARLPVAVALREL